MGLSFVCFALVFVSYCFYYTCLSLPSSLPGDNTLCRLPGTFLVRFSLPILSVFPAVFSDCVPGMVWFGSIYPRATAGYVADQLIM